MLNQVVLLGRLVECKKESIIIKVPRNYKNNQGVYDTDLIEIYLSESNYNELKKYNKLDDLVGVRGRVETKDNQIIIIGDKITFLTNKKGDDTNELQ